jgi:hypothetical protein
LKNEPLHPEANLDPQLKVWLAEAVPKLQFLEQAQLFLRSKKNLTINPKMFGVTEVL